MPMRAANQSDFLLGHEPLGRRPNIAKELRRIRENPVSALLQRLCPDAPHVLSNDFTRYDEAYWFYFLSMDRYLSAMSICARYSKGAAWVLRSGGRQRYTPSERKLADQHRRSARFVEYDLVNCLIHSRILLDRTIALLRHFLIGTMLPSFTSFNEHKKFFAKLSVPFGIHEEYARRIREHTEWFDVPIKLVRDKFVVHASPKHMRFMGYPMGGFELDLNIVLPDTDDPEKPLFKVKFIRVNALRLSYDLQDFLTWFNEYGLRATQSPGT